MSFVRLAGSCFESGSSAASTRPLSWSRTMKLRALSCGGGGKAVGPWTLWPQHAVRLRGVGACFFVGAAAGEAEA